MYELYLNYFQKLPEKLFYYPNTTSQHQINLDKQGLITQIFEKYEANIAKDIASLVTNRYVIDCKRGNCKIGESKMGGVPDLPLGMKWPKIETEYLTFLGQFNLEDFAKFPSIELPKKGYLYFFAELYSYEDCKIIYFENIDGFYKPNIPFEIIEPPKTIWQKIFYKKPKKYVLEECSISIRETADFPIFDHYLIEELQNKHKIEIPLYFNEVCPQSHQFLGYSNTIQGNIEGDESKLLFQVISCEELDLEIGDGGNFYFFIKPIDLKNKNFENVLFEMDCY